MQNAKNSVINHIFSCQSFKSFFFFFPVYDIIGMMFCIFEGLSSISVTQSYYCQGLHFLTFYTSKIF